MRKFIGCDVQIILYSSSIVVQGCLESMEDHGIYLTELKNPENRKIFNGIETEGWFDEKDVKCVLKLKPISLTTNESIKSKSKETTS